jgi:GT2 family glycosyltransferase
MSDGAGASGFRLLTPPADGVQPLEHPPTFSIVITAYQAAETIEAAVASALEQTHPAEEVVVVDDGSTDDLEGALSAVRGQIQLVTKPNGGVASARNAGVAVAKGDFIAALDADDRFHPRRLEALAELATERPDLDLITTDTNFVVEGKVVGRFQETTPFALEGQRSAIIDSCFVGGWPAVRLSRLRAVGGFDESLRIGEDWDCWLRLLLDGSRAGIVDEALYDYTLREGSLTSDSVANLWARAHLLEKARLNEALESSERAHLERAIRWRRSQAVREEIGLVAAGAAPRSRSIALARMSGVSARGRALALLAGVAPGFARRLIGAQDLPVGSLKDGDG